MKTSLNVLHLKVIKVLHLKKVFQILPYLPITADSLVSGQSEVNSTIIAVSVARARLVVV